MTKLNGDKASIREVYKLLHEVEDRFNQRLDKLEEKLDALANDIANIKGQATILGAVSGVAVTVVGWFINR